MCGVEINHLRTLELAGSRCYSCNSSQYVWLINKVRFALLITDGGIVPTAGYGSKAMNEQWITDKTIVEANRRFDAKFPHFRHMGRLSRSWKEETILMGPPLTDRRISYYASRGYYSATIKDARKAYQVRRECFRQF